MGQPQVQEGSSTRVTDVHPGLRHAVHLSQPALRTADGHHRDERRASWLELFFDLAFAGAVGQLAGAFQKHPGLTALAGFVMLFTPIWWLWVQLTFYADRHETKDVAHRISVLGAILLCVALAASAPAVQRPGGRQVAPGPRVQQQLQAAQAGKGDDEASRLAMEGSGDSVVKFWPPGVWRADAGLGGERGLYLPFHPQRHGSGRKPTRSAINLWFAPHSAHAGDVF